MPEAEIGKALQLLDLMLDFFTDDAHRARGRYDDGHRGHCLVGALLHLSREHRLPSTPAIALLQDAMPRPGLPLVHFNDNRCGTDAELRSTDPTHGLRPTRNYLSNPTLSSFAEFCFGPPIVMLLPITKNTATRRQGRRWRGWNGCQSS